MVGEHRQVNLENLRIEIPETGGKNMKYRSKKTKIDIYLERDKDIEVYTVSGDDLWQ